MDNNRRGFPGRYGETGIRLNRRSLLKMVTAGTVAAAMPAYAQRPKKRKNSKSVAQTVLPRWRGFNLLDMFTMRSRGDFREDDFRWMRDWGFDFVRFPMCYRLWIEDGDDYKLYEPMLEKLDRAVELAGKYGLHISLNFHRGPGYSVNREFAEPFNLWKDKEPLEAFCFHWQMLAKRYRGVSRDKLSFDLINEPPSIGQRMSRADHERVVRTAVAAIREINPDRIVIADGMSWGNEPAPELADLGIGQSTRAYQPMFISHHKASWVNSDRYPEPAWPGHTAGTANAWSSITGNGPTLLKKVLAYTVAKAALITRHPIRLFWLGCGMSWKFLPATVSA